MKIQKIYSETKELIAKLNPVYNSYSEMTLSEQEFLTDLVRQYKPKKLLELGIASGSSSVLLLNAIKDMPESHLTSIDYSTLYYRNKSKNSGFVVDEYPELKDKWTLYTGALASEFMDKVGANIDFCFIDTMHALPGEVIDFLLVLPYLKPDAVVVFHDTNLQTWGNWPQCTSNNMLVSAISGEKIVPETFENIFFHNTLKVDFQMYFPNITGIILDGMQKEKIWDIFNLLTQKWKYILKSEDIKSIRTSLKRHYSDFYVSMFDSILNYQLDTAKNDQTIQDIIRENKELIDRKLQNETQVCKALAEGQNILKTEVCAFLEKTRQDIIQQTKEQRDWLKQNADILLAGQNENFLSLSSKFDKKWKQAENAKQQFLSVQEENFNHIVLNIQRLNDSVNSLKKELNTAIVRSHQNMEMWESRFLNLQQLIKQEHNEFAVSVSKLKLYVNAVSITKQYWYYKLFGWVLFPFKRGKYKQKYREIKYLYEKIGELRYDF